MLSSCGGALSYLPIGGMLGIDWGYGFDKAVGQTERSGSLVHFIIGTQFLLIGIRL